MEIQLITEKLISEVFSEYEDYCKETDWLNYENFNNFLAVKFNVENLSIDSFKVLKQIFYLKRSLKIKEQNTEEWFLEAKGYQDEIDYLNKKIKNFNKFLLIGKLVENKEGLLALFKALLDSVRNDDLVPRQNRHLEACDLFGTQCNDQVIESFESLAVKELLK